MLYAIGLNSDSTLNHFIRQAENLGEEVVLIDLHKICMEPWCISIPSNAYTSKIEIEKNNLVLDPNAGYYARLIDLSSVLPEPSSTASRHLITGISAFLETATGRVVNRPGGHVHNGAKPYHEWWLSQQGFLIPPAITTSNKDNLIRFLNIHKSGIVKALCGMRGSAQAVTASDFDLYEVEQGPVHLQKYIKGFDVRIHVVGNSVHAEKIESDSVDYRVKSAESTYSSFRIPKNLITKLILASQKMRLIFTGWDFKVDEEGQYWCLEVNPMPGYDGYDRRSNGEISKSLVCYLRNNH